MASPTTFTLISHGLQILAASSRRLLGYVPFDCQCPAQRIDHCHILGLRVSGSQRTDAGKRQGPRRFNTVVCTDAQGRSTALYRGARVLNCHRGQLAQYVDEPWSPVIFSPVDRRPDEQRRGCHACAHILGRPRCSVLEGQFYAVSLHGLPS